MITIMPRRCRTAITAGHELGPTSGTPQVQESVQDELLARLTGALENLVVGDPAEEATMMGPLIREQQRSRVEGLIAGAVDEGAELVFGGGRPAGLDRGFFVEPTLFTGVRNDMRIAREEVFGPGGVVIPFSDEDEAARLANDSDYGLAGGVWSAALRSYERRVNPGSVSAPGASSVRRGGRGARSW